MHFFSKNISKKNRIDILYRLFCYHPTFKNVTDSKKERTDFSKVNHYLRLSYLRIRHKNIIGKGFIANQFTKNLMKHALS